MDDWKKAARKYIKQVQRDYGRGQEGSCCWYLEKALAEIKELDGELRAIGEADLPGPPKRGF